MEERLQRQRFERKYFITARQADQIREIVRAHLVPDSFGEGRPDHAYPVYSLYVDSSELTTYWATVQCEKRRFKLRVRYYDEDSESPLFFEIKRRENDCILKHRGAVRRSAGAALLAGRLPGREHLVVDGPSQLAALQKFCQLMVRLHARPTATVTYLREAWVSPRGNSARVTIDRDVRGELRREADFTTRLDHPVYPFGDRRVLELKFTDRFPDWFRDLTQHFNLNQSSAPKYCGSVSLAGEVGARNGVRPGLGARVPAGALVIR
ncbi:MAG: polyphosphate polymerase domain-containing protein [Verrucomicrobiae bacterium]|nr:polyphosphate polymerase domain-containing protein [Verrucomicrobiae bacterium]